MCRSAAHAFLVVIVTNLSTTIAVAQASDPPTLSPGGPTIPEKEKLRVPKASSFQNEYGETIYIIKGSESWRRTELRVKRGQKMQIAADGVVRWAPDGIEKIDVTPDGTRPPYRDGWNYYHFPYPEAGIGSLVMRIGKGIYRIGSERVVEAEDSGFVEFMVNDDILDDNSGAFTVRVRVLGTQG